MSAARKLARRDRKRARKRSKPSDAEVIEVSFDRRERDVRCNWIDERGRYGSRDFERYQDEQSWGYALLRGERP